MREFAERLGAMDPDSRDSMRVITYFDQLLSGGAGVPALVRAAAVLSGVVAGARIGRRVLRYGPDGARVDGSPDGTSPTRAVEGGSVWLEAGERVGLNETMIVDRLALAIEITQARADELRRDWIAFAIDPTSTAEELARARAALGARTVRVVVTAPDGKVEQGCPSALVPTSYGMVKVVIATGESATVPVAGRAGIGTLGTVDGLPESFDAALLAFLLADDARPHMMGDQLGALTSLVRAVPQMTRLPHDVVRIDALDEASRRTAYAMMSEDSIRHAAAALSLHHSTLSARLPKLEAALGFDLATAVGRARFSLAWCLWILWRAREPRTSR